MGHGVDGLNLMALMATIDPSLSNQAAAFLSSFVREASNLPFNSYEVLLDGLRRLFMGSDIASTIVAANFSGPARENFYTNMKALGDLFEPDAALAHMVGNIYLVPATGVEARNDYGQFLALYFATPFALEGGEPFLSQLHTSLYDRWKSDQSLTDAERADGRASFSDQWYEDRSAYLTALLSRNENDIDATDSANSHNLSTRYFAVDGINQDRAVVYTGAANAESFASLNAARIVFGDDTANAPANGVDAFIGGNGNDRMYGMGGDDRLQGFKGDDYLEGGEGNDTLDGGEGNDTLVGGAGEDQYIFTGNFGHDTLIDSDGTIVIDRQTIGAFTHMQAA